MKFRVVVIFCYHSSMLLLSKILNLALPINNYPFHFRAAKKVYIIIYLSKDKPVIVDNSSISLDFPGSKFKSKI